MQFFAVEGNHYASPATFGGKGFGLYAMSNMGIRVPPAIVIPTTECARYRKNPDAWRGELGTALSEIYEYFIGRLGYMPLLSVRSGAPVSMPGMMDTILNIGLTPDAMDEWVERLGERCAKDCLERLAQMYHDVVAVPLPESLDVQVVEAVAAVFNSWDNERARIYRDAHGIDHDMGTAVVIQAMVFGNFNEKSGTGVLFTCNPSTGADVITGEWLAQAQGEDIVAGLRTPQPIETVCDAAWWPEVKNWACTLEHQRTHPQDIEFTVQDGVPYLLQTRDAKLASAAKVAVACRMADVGWIASKQIVERLTHADFLAALLPRVADGFKGKPVVTGIPACPGIVSGKVVLDSSHVCLDSILFTRETNPDDIAGMIAARGVLTRTGGATCHAAVVARSLNKPCVVGAGEDFDFKEGDLITIDGTTGRVWKGVVPVVDAARLDRLGYHLSKVAGCTLIDDHDAPMLDVSDLSPKDALAVVKRVAREAVVETIIVDVSQHQRDPELGLFFGQYPQLEREKDLIGELNLKLPLKLRKKVRYITNVPLASEHVLPTVSTVEGLMESEGRVVFHGAATKANERAIKLLRQEGQEVITLGEPDTGGYASVFQLAQKLLT